MNTRLRDRRPVATVVMALAAGAGLVACQGGVSVATGVSAGTSAPAPVTTAPVTTAPAATAPAATATGTSALATKEAGSGGSSATHCRTADLGFSFGPDSGAQIEGSPGEIDVLLTNKGTATCTLRGFPGVEVVSASGTHWQLVRQSTPAGTVTVEPGSTASFAITYTPFEGGDPAGTAPFHAASILLTPPDETRSVTLPWDGFADLVNRKDSTYVGPVVAGG